MKKEDINVNSWRLSRKFVNPQKYYCYSRDIYHLLHILLKDESLEKATLGKLDTIRILHNSRKLLREIEASSVKSLRNFSVSTELLRSDSNEKRIVITFWGKQTHKCLCFSKNFSQTEVLFRTNSDTGHSVLSQQFAEEPSMLEALLGDFKEKYNRIKENKSFFYRVFWLFWEFFKSYTLMKGVLISIIEAAVLFLKFIKN